MLPAGGRKAEKLKYCGAIFDGDHAMITTMSNESLLSLHAEGLAAIRLFHGPAQAKKLSKKKLPDAAFLAA
jgi:hypothetical protein